MTRKNGTTGSDMKGWDGGESANGDKDGGNGGHGFGMFGREEVERVRSVEEPEGSRGRYGGDYFISHHESKGRESEIEQLIKV